MRPTFLLVLALAVTVALAGCASPARESSDGGTDETTGSCSGHSCRDTLEVTDPNGTGNATNSSNQTG